jgi:hypothetical protein
MGYGNRDKPVHKSGRVGFVEGRLNELRRRWENATDEREKSEVSEQIREWHHSGRNDPHPPARDGRRSLLVTQSETDLTTGSFRLHTFANR